MATLENKKNREVKVIIPNMREFRTFYSDNEGSVVFFKRDWEECTKQEEHWKPSKEQLEALHIASYGADPTPESLLALAELYEQLKKMI